MADKRVPTAKLRRQILNGRKVEMEKGTKELSPVKLDYELTDLMRLKELEFGEVIHVLIAKKRGTIYKVAKRIGVHPSTVYLWRERLLIE